MPEQIRRIGSDGDPRHAIVRIPVAWSEADERFRVGKPVRLLLRDGELRVQPVEE